MKRFSRILIVLAVAILLFPGISAAIGSYEFDFSAYIDDTATTIEDAVVEDPTNSNPLSTVWATVYLDVTDFMIGTDTWFHYELRIRNVDYQSVDIVDLGFPLGLQVVTQPVPISQFTISSVHLPFDTVTLGIGVTTNGTDLETEPDGVQLVNFLFDPTVAVGTTRDVVEFDSLFSERIARGSTVDGAITLETHVLSPLDEGEEDPNTGVVPEPGTLLLLGSGLLGMAGLRRRIYKK